MCSIKETVKRRITHTQALNEEIKRTFYQVEQRKVEVYEDDGFKAKKILKSKG